MDKPDALRLADELDQYLYSVPAHPLCTDAAAELRRLHAENEVMRNVANRGGHIAVAMSRIADLDAQRDALLEALNNLVDHIDLIPTDPYYREETQELMGSARAAIKAVEEGK